MRIVECQQYDSVWWDIRRGVPTCSAFGKILTPKGALSASWKKYAYLLIAEKFDAYYDVGEEYQDAAFGGEGSYQSESMEVGSLREPKAKGLYEILHGVTPVDVGFIFADGDRYGGSPDALVGEDGCLEVKSPQGKTHIEYLLGEDVPDKYRPQCHGHLIVTGREWCDFMSFVPGFPDFIVRVVPDDYTAALKSALEEFCDKYAAMLATVESRLQDTIAARTEQPADYSKEMSSFVA
jgi:hypothetical protein